MMETTTKPAFMTIAAYEEAQSLPEAIKLNRDFIRYEREFCRNHFTDSADEEPGFTRAECLKSLDEFEHSLDAAERIWNEAIAAARSHIAERIRAEVLKQENYGNIASCVESGDYSGMAC